MTNKVISSLLLRKDMPREDIVNAAIITALLLEEWGFKTLAAMFLSVKYKKELKSWSANSVVIAPIGVVELKQLAHIYRFAAHNQGKLFIDDLVKMAVTMVWECDITSVRDELARLLIRVN